MLQAALLVLGLIERTFALGPEIVNLIDRLRRGEEITEEEIQRTEELVNDAKRRWDEAGDKPKENQ